MIQSVMPAVCQINAVTQDMHSHKNPMERVEIAQQLTNTQLMDLMKQLSNVTSLITHTSTSH
jgi:hypothetical protein